MNLIYTYNIIFIFMYYMHREQATLVFCGFHLNSIFSSYYETNFPVKTCYGVLMLSSRDSAVS